MTTPEIIGTNPALVLMPVWISAWHCGHFIVHESGPNIFSFFHTSVSQSKFKKHVSVVFHSRSFCHHLGKGKKWSGDAQHNLSDWLKTVQVLMLKSPSINGFILEAKSRSWQHGDLFTVRDIWCEMVKDGKRKTT